jgi:pantetheine-phosphate adenylyltransferase
MKFKTVAVGGTFDKLHKGHEALLSKAFEVGEQVLIGLSSDDFVKTMRKPHPTAPYAQRAPELRAFLRKKHFLERSKIIPLKDVYGPALTSDTLEALVVTKETEMTAFEINKRRKEAGMSPLHIIVIGLISSEDDLPISTSRIRSGKIDRYGRLLKTCPK